ncbi:hypothetical protein HanIR_Chr10g0500291 [Helianthus annuus]|nr:hypothetical protein HanIR_Chr10g0500291 [Helianthus annuus]
MLPAMLMTGVSSSLAVLILSPKSFKICWYCLLVNPGILLVSPSIRPALDFVFFFFGGGGCFM